MAIALVPGQHAAASFNTGAASIAVSFPAVTGGGNLIPVFSMCNSAQSSTAPTDDKSNTYASSAPETTETTGNQKISGWYAKNCVSGTLTVTAHFSASTSFGAVGIAEFSGADTVAPLDQIGGLFTAASADALSPSRTPTTNGQLIWGAAVNNIGASNTTGTSFTLLDTNAGSGYADEYFVQGTAAAISAEFKTASSGAWAVLIATFKAAAAGVNPTELAPPIALPLYVVPPGRAQFFQGGVATLRVPLTPRPLPLTLPPEKIQPFQVRAFQGLVATQPPPPPAPRPLGLPPAEVLPFQVWALAAARFPPFALYPQALREPMVLMPAAPPPPVPRPPALPTLVVVRQPLLLPTAIIPVPADVVLWGIIAGITRDCTGGGVPVGFCVVHLFRTADDIQVATTTSDVNGNYRFTLMQDGTTYYAVAYKVGAPDLAGTTVNTLRAA